jgi:glycosyltransferase involved in cell wall biosynthesis
MDPLVSVVTPVYNGERYLAECIESVLGQTYSHWEYIVADNCSTDGTRELAERYARKDPRVRVLGNDRFVSAVENHNRGLRAISSRSAYCKVLHADDWLFPECLARMVSLAEQHPSVGIVGAYGLVDTRVRWDGLPHTSQLVAGREMCRLTLLGHPYVFGSPTSILMRADLVRARDPFYDEAFHPYSDGAACFDLLQRADFGFVHQVLTYTRTHRESVTATVYDRYGTAPVNYLHLLVRYGPIYLSRHEYERALGDLKAGYYRFLARNLFRKADRRRFWAMHREALARMGLPLSRGALLRALAVESLVALVDVKAALRRLLGRGMPQPGPGP